MVAGLAPSAEQAPLVIVLSTTLVDGALEFCNVCITSSRSSRRDHLHLSVAKPTDEGDRGAGAIGSPRDCDNRLYLRGNCHAVLDFRDSSVLNQGLSTATDDPTTLSSVALTRKQGKGIEQQLWPVVSQSVQAQRSWGTRQGEPTECSLGRQTGALPNLAHSCCTT